MPKDDTVNLEDSEMDEIDHELEEFKRFCLIKQTTGDPSKGCCDSEPEGPCF